MIAVIASICLGAAACQDVVATTFSRGRSKMSRWMIAVAFVAVALTHGAPALAAKCYIREYAAIAAARVNAPYFATQTVMQIASEPGSTDQVTSDFSSAAVQSNAFTSTTAFVRLWCDTQASFLFGTNPTATNANAPIAAGTPEYFGVPLNGGYKVSVHTNP